MFWVVIVLLTFSNAQGNLAAATFLDNGQFESKEICMEHVAGRMKEVQDAVKAGKYGNLGEPMDWAALCMKFAHGKKT